MSSPPKKKKKKNSYEPNGGVTLKTSVYQITIFFFSVNQNWMAIIILLDYRYQTNDNDVQGSWSVRDKLRPNLHFKKILV